MNSERHVYSYNSATFQMERTFVLLDDIPQKYVDRPDLLITIDLSLNLIIQHGTTSRLSSADNYCFLDFMKNIIATDDLMTALLANEYYTKTFLSDSLGVFVVPFAPDFLSHFYVFGTLVFPYENLYSEQLLKPKYADRITAKYDENNSALLRKAKEILREVLVIPGIPLTPLIYLVVISALNRSAPAGYLGI